MWGQDVNFGCHSLSSENFLFGWIHKASKPVWSPAVCSEKTNGGAWREHPSIQRRLQPMWHRRKTSSPPTPATAAPQFYPVWAGGRVTTPLDFIQTICFSSTLSRLLLIIFLLPLLSSFFLPCLQLFYMPFCWDSKIIITIDISCPLLFWTLVSSFSESCWWSP